MLEPKRCSGRRFNKDEREKYFLFMRYKILTKGAIVDINSTLNSWSEYSSGIRNSSFKKILFDGRKLG